MPETLDDKDWHLLLRRIEAQKCTPFLGAGACAGVLPLGGQIAREWAALHDYPLQDSSDLARVAQYLVLKYDPMYPKEELLLNWFRDATPPDYGAECEPHGVLANLPLPVYITTNYDGFMVGALRDRNKNPRRELCRWNQLVKEHPSVFDNGYEPTAAEPIVFHLHGHDQVPESLVLTEDDYVDFLVNVSDDSELLPLRIREALAGSSLVFVGYSLADWDFRVLFRGLVERVEKSLQRISVTVQLEPPADASPSEAEALRLYVIKYFGRMQVSVYFGTAKEFVGELWQRWEEYCNGR